ncbi:nicotinate-nucleotide adenylyltransferase [Thalassotalea atypica]|uniref:nicotinate-nucleotide adenylyltransferase n=1 Tax=Thalassotalea atypica TaxID=2054316 RepID=UPI002573AE86|nr:nicotinate-nucleotide adenylyltransferase [Thalassotalea atypica]
MNSHQSRDIAILGGTFDPIHLGHIIPAQQIIGWMSISELILLPAHIPPHKSRPLTPSNVRVEMVELVCQQHDNIACDTRELSRNKPSYTIDTLKEFRQEYPAHRLFFLIGMDSLISFTTWFEWQNILKLCHIVVSTRPGYDKDTLSEETKQLLEQRQVSLESLGKEKSGKIIMAPPCEYDISSTMVREYIAQQKTVEQYLTPEVAKYINAHQLYNPINKSNSEVNARQKKC